MSQTLLPRSRLLLSVALTALLAVSLASGAAFAAGEGGERPPAAVTVVPAIAQDHLLTSRLPGRVKASQVAEVRPQVSGIIRERLFDEGSVVEAGQPIYKIEDDAYRAAVAAAEATVAQARASFDLAVTEEKRALDLFGSNAGSAQKRDSAIASRQAAEAALKAAEARLMSAEIDLDRTTIRAPIAGVIGLSQTTIGALVGAQQAMALTTIRDLDTVYVDVTQSAVDILRWSDNADADVLQATASAEMTLADGNIYNHKGALSAAEPQVEPTTGMVTLRLTYENPEHKLLPGMYVEVDLPNAVSKGAILVPQNAVMRDRTGGTFVWVVDNGVVAVRNVTIARSTGNQWIITDGLEPNAQVITSGFQKTGPGAPVQIVPAAGEPAPADAAPAEAGAQ